MSRFRIFETDPDAAPKARPSTDIVGSFRSGRATNGKPEALSEWRITTGDPDLADRLAAMFGGQVAAWETAGEEKLELLTDVKSVKVILDGPDDIRAGMVMWSAKGNLVRSCDGVEQDADDDGVRKPCVCPASFADRKQASKDGTGCDPSIKVYFRLADAPELGRFRFSSGSWNLAREIDSAQDDLEDIGGPARATLSLELVEYKAKSGPRKGKMVSFTMPVVKVKGPYEAAAAEAA